MKKIIPSTILLIAGAMLFSADAGAQGITITKRHYTGGYYIDFGGRKKTVAKTVQAGKQNISSVETKSMDAIPLATEEAPEQMTLVATQSVSVKREKENKHIAIDNIIAAKSAKIEGNNNENETYNRFSPVADDASTQVNATADNVSGLNLLLVVIITIFIPPLGVALARGIHIEFWIDLILTLLFYFPGLIYGLIVVLS